MKDTFDTTLISQSLVTSLVTQCNTILPNDVTQLKEAYNLEIDASTMAAKDDCTHMNAFKDRKQPFRFT